MKLLVVDDSSTMRRIIKNTLARLGYKDIIEGADGVEGWDQINTNPDVDMLITDWNMPEMNGFEFITRLRQNQEWKSIPIIINSAKELTLEERGRLQGDVEKIFKKGDVTCGELLQSVRQLAVQAKNGKP